MKTQRTRFRHTLCKIVKEDTRKWLKKLKTKYKVCYKCGSPEAYSPDHHNPLSCGFLLTDANAVLLCHLCNNVKADADPKEFYSKEELIMLDKTFGVKTSAVYNRNFMVEMEFLYELVKHLSISDIRGSILTSGLLNKYIPLKKGQYFDISYSTNTLCYDDVALMNHVEKLLVIDSTNPYLNYLYEEYTKRAENKEQKNNTVKVNVRPSSKRQRPRQKRHNNKTKHRSNHIEKTVSASAPVATNAPAGYDWLYWVGKTLDIQLGKDLVFDIKPFCILEDSLDKIVKELPIPNFKGNETISFKFTPFSLTGDSKRVIVSLFIDGTPWKSFKVGSSYSLERFRERLLKRLHTEFETFQDTAA
jgi:hypothetical protein